MSGEKVTPMEKGASLIEDEEEEVDEEIVHDSLSDEDEDEKEAGIIIHAGRTGSSTRRTPFSKGFTGMILYLVFDPPYDPHVDVNNFYHNWPSSIFNRRKWIFAVVSTTTGARQQGSSSAFISDERLELDIQFY
jgi:hypothetical protein